jgi:hypothetical protein
MTGESIPPAGEVRLRVEAVFHCVEERHAQRIAAEMIDRAHELANLPDCQCDVDVSVHDSHVERAAQPASARPLVR